MASGAEIAGAVGQGASIIPALIGKGKNTNRAPGFVGQPGYDPNASKFGGSETGLKDYRADLANRRAQADGRTAFQADYGNANNWENQSLAARAEQGQIANLMHRRATGATPSIASQQGALDAQRAQAAQMSAAASARGPAGLALAQQGAANNTANAQSAISNNAQINAANERLQAEQAAFGAYSGMRAGDQSSQGMSTQQAQFQAGMQQQNRDANDRRAGLSEQLEGQALGQSLQAGVQNQSTLANAQTASTTANQRTDDQNAQSKGLFETVGDFFSDSRAKYITSDFTAKLPPLMGGGRMGPSVAAAPEAFAGQQGMLNGSPLGELQAHSNFATQYATDPTGGMGGSSFLSDDKAKLAEAWDQGHAAAVADVMKLSKAPAKDVKRISEDEARPWNQSQAAQAAREAKTRGWDEGHQTAQYVPTVMVQPPAQSPAPQAPRETPTLDALDKGARVALKSTMGPIFGPAAVYASEKVGRKITGENDITSDTRAKEQARAEGVKQGMALAGKPRLGPAPGMTMKTEAPATNQAQYVPGRGWVQPGADEAAARAQDFDDTLAKQAEEDRTYAQQDKDAAELALKDSNAAEAKKIKTGFDNAEEMKKIQAGFATDAAGAKKEPTFLEALGSGVKSLNEAQFGDHFKSDERAKVIGPSKGDLADANRKMKGQPYVYKPGMTPPDQEPGEANFGFMAQNLEKNPISATAVKEDPATGLKKVDAHKMIKVIASGLADLQEQEDETRMMLAKGGKKRKGK